MENKILIALAIFSISILLSQVYITNQVYAQLVIETASFGATHTDTTTFPECAYISSTQVWCATNTGIKVWNPTTRTLTATLGSGNSWDDIKCDLLCYSWDKTAGAPQTANLTSWTITTRELVNTTLFTDNTGGQISNGIGLVTGTGSNTLLLGIEGQLCGAGADLKGMCVWDGIGWAFTRFISDGSTNDNDWVIDIEWNGQSATVADPSLNRAVVHHVDSVGNKRLYLLNLADSDTTFSTTEKCNTGVLAGTTNQLRLQVIDGIAYLPVGTQDLINITTLGTSPTCGVFTKSNFVDENIPVTILYSSNDNLFYVSSTSSNSGVVTSFVYVFNGTNFAGTTSFDRELKINITSSTSDFIPHEMWLHPSEGELQVWQDSIIKIISGILESTGETPTEEFCSLPENENILICRLESSPPLTGASELLNQSSTNIVCMIGLLECTQDSEGNFTPTNGDIKTNGVGYLLTIIAFGIMISIFWLASGGRLGDIPTFVWFIATLGLLGVMVGFDFLDVTFLLIGIIAVIALAVARIKGLFGDAGLFKGE